MLDADPRAVEEGPPPGRVGRPLLWIAGGVLALQAAFAAAVAWMLGAGYFG
ncbi:MAG: hypothetical protein FJ090_20930 [Deltaproteobacteria bacterium]|nr:hypothetical protein [Deltaproteobacteria bacterium]